MSCGIYKITNLINKKVYIGQSTEIENRWEAEKAGYINKHAYNAFKKYGIENFLFEIVIECELENLDELEIYYIQYYNSCNSKYGYNKLSGGYNGRPNEEIREKISNTLKEYYKNNKDARKNISNRLKGKKLSKQHKINIGNGISKEKNYQWVERTPEMINDLKKLTIREWRKKYNQSRNMFYRLRYENNITRDDRRNYREISSEMIENVILGKTKFMKKYQCSERFFYKIKKGEY